MDLENARNWAKQPDVCRGCLAKNGCRDLTASYITLGTKEVYSDMLKECFSISLSHLTEWGGYSRLVCTECVQRLRDAYTFKRQVLDSEKQFLVVVGNTWNLTAQHVEHEIKLEPIKSEPEDDQRSPCASPSPEQLPEQDQNKQENKEETKKLKKDIGLDGSIVIKKRKKKRSPAKSKNKMASTQYGDDTDDSFDKPLKRSEKIAEQLEIKTEILDESFETLPLKKRNKVSHKSDKSNGPMDTKQLQITTKQLSERKRVMTTSNIVLKNTNACPFRHQKSWFQCFYCLQEFMELNLLRTHTLEVHKDTDAELNKLKRYPRSLQIDISSLKCLNCNLDLQNVEVMRTHFLNAHNKIIYKESIADYKVDISPYACHICMQEFHVFRSLTTHLNEHYANCICDVCGKSFINSKRLKVHKRTHESGQFTCKECGKVLKTKTSKANHMESAHSKRILKCHICSEIMKHYNDRIKHMSEIHNITHKFKCSICPREYNIKHYLATHMRQTHGHKNKKCTECGMAFITNHGLKKHMLKHTGERPFACTLCNKSYARNYTLREHMRVHTSERRFLCQE